MYNQVLPRDSLNLLLNRKLHRNTFAKWVGCHCKRLYVSIAFSLKETRVHTSLHLYKLSKEIRSFKTKNDHAEGLEGYVYSLHECISHEVFNRL